MNYECVVKRSAAEKVATTAREIEEPGPVDPGMVLLEVKRSVLDVGHLDQVLPPEQTGQRWERLGWCSLMGHVAQVGSESQDFRIGDRVSAIGPIVSRVQLSAQECLSVPDDVDADQATFWALFTALVRFARKLQIEIGESVLVLGGGLTGQLCAQLVVAAGAARVVGIDFNNPYHESGGPEPTPMWVTDQNALQKALPGREVDVLIDVLGDFKQLYDLLPLVRVGGRALLLGVNDATPIDFDFYPNIHRRSLTLIGATLRAALQQHPAGEMTTAREAAFINHLLKNGRVNPAQRPLAWVHPSPAIEQTVSTFEAVSFIVQWDKADATG